MMFHRKGTNFCSPLIWILSNINYRRCSFRGKYYQGEKITWGEKKERKTQHNGNAHSPPSLGDDHFCAIPVELVPELLGLEIHFGIILDIVILRGRRPRREGSEREAGEEAGVAVGGVKTVGGPKTWNRVFWSRSIQLFVFFLARMGGNSNVDMHVGSWK